MVKYEQNLAPNIDMANAIMNHKLSGFGVTPDDEYSILGCNSTMTVAFPFSTTH